MAFLWWSLLLAPLLARAVQIGELSAGAKKAFDKYYETYLNLASPGGIDELIALAEPDATAVQIVGPKAVTSTYHDLVGCYREGLKNVKIWDSRWLVLQASGDQVTVEFTQFGVMESGCEFSMMGIHSVMFNSKGKLAYCMTQMRSEDLENFEACSTDKPKPTRSTFLPSAALPKGAAEWYKAFKALPELGMEKGYPTTLSFIAPGATVRAYSDSKLTTGSLHDYLAQAAGFSSWETNWQVVFKTEYIVLWSFVDFIVMPSCSFDHQGLMQVTFNEEGKITHMWSHTAKSAMSHCVLSGLAERPALEVGATPMALVALVGAMAGTVLTLGAMVLVRGFWQSPSRMGNMPLLQKPGEADGA